MDRRTLLKSAGLIGLSALIPASAFAAEIDTSALADMTKDAVPISRDERARRLARAQELMKRNGIGAVVIEPGSSLIYFTGVKWWRSERLTLRSRPTTWRPRNTWAINQASSRLTATSPIIHPRV